MTSLTEFLLARIAEDEAVAAALVARDVFAPTQGPNMERLHEDDEYSIVVIGEGRVLAECEAKRRIVEEHAGDARPRPKVSGWVHGEPCHICRDSVEPLRLPCPTLRALATIYAEHPDYYDEWRP